MSSFLGVVTIIAHLCTNIYKEKPDTIDIRFLLLLNTLASLISLCLTQVQSVLALVNESFRVLRFRFPSLGPLFIGASAFPLILISGRDKFVMIFVADELIKDAVGESCKIFS